MDKTKLIESFEALDPLVNSINKTFKALIIVDTDFQNDKKQVRSDIVIIVASMLIIRFKVFLDEYSIFNDAYKTSHPELLQKVKEFRSAYKQYGIAEGRNSLLAHNRKNKGDKSTLSSDEIKGLNMPQSLEEFSVLVNLANEIIGIILLVRLNIDG